VVKASGPRDIVAAVPFICGFHPEQSIVVISLRGPRHRFGMVSRLDLPPVDEASAGAESWDEEEIADDIAGFVARDGGNGAVVVVYDERPWSDPRPHGSFVGTLVESLEVRGLAVLDAIYVSAGRYWSYTCDQERCCPIAGRSVAEAQSSPVAMAYVMAGNAPLASRSALVERIRPRSALLVAAVEDSMWRWLEAQAAALDGVMGRLGSGPAPLELRRDHLRPWTGEAFALMAALVQSYRDGEGRLTVEQAGQLLASLHSRDIRDAVLMGFCRFGMAPPEDPGELLATGFDPRLAVIDNLGLGLDRGAQRSTDRQQPSEPATEGEPEAPDEADEPEGADELERDSETEEQIDDAVERLFVDLCQRVEGPFACAPLTMLAWHSWARGEGALARVAVERALGEDPTYRLATLLLSALDHAVAPDWVADIRRSDERAS
jgi:hypothetical protein